MSYFRAESISLHFGGLKAVDAVSFAVEKGEILSIIGPNGAGKSSIFNLISRIYTPTSGKIFFEDQDITEVPAYGIAKLGIGLVADRWPTRTALLVNFAIVVVASFLLIGIRDDRSLLTPFVLAHGIATMAQNVVYPLIVAWCFGTRYLAPIYGVLAHTARTRGSA